MAKAVAALGIVLVVLATGGVSGAAQSGGCTRYAAATGADWSNGSKTHPFRTVRQLIKALPDGGVGCLRSGSTFAAGRVIVTHPVTIRSEGGHATIVGGVTIEPRAAGSTISGLTIHGRGSARSTVLVQGNGVRVVGNTIDGSGYLNRNAACIFLDVVRNVVVDSNRISTCTRTSSGDLSAPGVFVGSAYGAHVTNNLITHTAGFGISIGPNGQHSIVTHNIVDGSVGGVLIDGSAKTASSYNVVQNNVFSNSSTWNVHTSWSGLVGKGNAVVANCLWHGGSGNVQAPGVALVGNVVANPHYASNYTIAGGPCAAKRPGFLEAPTRVPPFVVRYRLQALPERVRFLSLQLANVTPGAHVLVRCSRTCSERWEATARGGAVSVDGLAGRWFGVGAAIDVLVTSPGHPGAWARITITGLPHGVSVTHACLPPGGAAPVPCSRYR